MPIIKSSLQMRHSKRLKIIIKYNYKSILYKLHECGLSLSDTQPDNWDGY